jgi:hypothetical protein
VICIPLHINARQPGHVRGDRADVLAEAAVEKIHIFIEDQFILGRWNKCL